MEDGGSVLEALLGSRAHRGRLVAVRQGRRTRARAGTPSLLCCPCRVRNEEDTENDYKRHVVLYVEYLKVNK